MALGNYLSISIVGGLFFKSIYKFLYSSLPQTVVVAINCAILIKYIFYRNIYKKDEKNVIFAVLNIY